MSRIQIPMSVQKTKEADVLTSLIQAREPDFGFSTLDIGLTVNDLRKSFLAPSGERNEVLRGVTFEGRVGQMVAIRGASGAGKSTLLQLLGGIEQVDHGEILFGQFSVHSAGPAAIAQFRNREVGYIFQFHHLLADLSAAENVALPLMIGGMNRRKAMAAANQALKDLGLSDRTGHAAGSLSGGEQQRVAVCRALITQPALVLADEPTGNLDAVIEDQIARDLVSYTHSRPALVMVATHNDSMANRCDRILDLRDGRIHES